MINWFVTLMKRIGFVECEHDENVRTAGKFVTCSICKTLVLMANFTVKEEYEDGSVVLEKTDE
jgi:hypothetical protein